MVIKRLIASIQKKLFKSTKSEMGKNVIKFGIFTHHSYYTNQYISTGNNNVQNSVFLLYLDNDINMKECEEYKLIIFHFCTVSNAFCLYDTCYVNNKTL